MAEQDVNQQKTDAAGLVRSVGKASAPNYLGDAEVVDRLVRDFAFSVIDRFDQVAYGRILPNDASAADQALCLKMAAIFNGKADGYAPVENWSGAQLANHIRRVYRDSIFPEDDDSVVAQAFAVLAHQIYDQIRDGSEPEQMIDAINQGVHSLARLLLGASGIDE